MVGYPVEAADRRAEDFQVEVEDSPEAVPRGAGEGSNDAHPPRFILRN